MGLAVSERSAQRSLTMREYRITTASYGSFPSGFVRSSSRRCYISLLLLSVMHFLAEGIRIPPAENDCALTVS